MHKILTNIGDKNTEVMIGGKTGPRVVILPGMSSSMDEWEVVTNQLGSLTNFIIINRPGCGKSELGSESRTTWTTITDLKKLLDKLNIMEPIILVGHSYGGLCAQHYAKTFPNKVAGVILVDSTSVDLHKLNEIHLTNDEDSDTRWIEKCIQYSKMSTKQLEKEIVPQIDQNQKELSLGAQSEILTFQTNPNLYKAMASEIQSWGSCAIKIKKAGTFPEIPLIIIGRDPEYSINLAVQEDVAETDAKAIEDVWQKLIEEQVLLSRHSEFITAKKSGHAVHLDNPQIIINSIARLLGYLV